jgi:hypothetical protein
MSRLRCLLAIACLTIFVATAAPGHADEVQPATHVAPVRLPEPTAPVSVRFSQQPAQVGDRVAQQVDFELNLSTSIIQSGQVANQENTLLQRRQQRLVEVTEVAEGKVRRARVTFSLARHNAPENNNSEQRPEQEPQHQDMQPVEGKTYLLTRQGEQLLVTDAQGAIPPRDEFEIVFSSMQSLGLPNPLAQFLLDRTIHVGQSLELSKEIAAQMLGFGDELGEVKRFELELKELSTYEGAPCAVFAATIEIAGNGEAAGDSMQINVTGPVVILTETCRTVVTDLTGPLSFDAHQHTSLGSYQYRATGTMRATVRARYAKRTQ